MSSQLLIKKRKSPLSSKKKTITHTHKFKQEWSIENCSYVIAWNYVGISQCTISAMFMPPLPRSTVQTIIKRFQETGTTDSAPRSGRPPKLNNEDLCLLQRIVTKDTTS